MVIASTAREFLAFLKTLRLNVKTRSQK